MQIKPLPTRRNYLIRARDHLLSLGAQTQVMGIVNLTPDSFSRDGCLKKGLDHTAAAVRQARRFVRQGAHIIDVGGESSRPGSRRISAKQEIQRIIPTVVKLTKTLPVPISVDTYKPLVAKHALDAGASIINTIKGGQPDRSLLNMVKNYQAAIILMHMRGTPLTMQRNVKYAAIMDEIYISLQKSIQFCLDIGIKSDKIIIDPGVGFGKSHEHNLEIVNKLASLAGLRQPILIGTSRKSFIGQVLKKTVDQRLMGTAATVCASILNGAHIVRVHDVKHIVDVVKMSDAILNPERT